MEERHEYTEPRPNNNCEAVQEAKASVEVLTCFSNEQMHSIPDNQELGTTPECTSKTAGPDDEKSGVQQNMEEETKELGSGDVLSELPEKNNQTISKLAEIDQVEAGNLLSSDIETENLILPIELETTTLNECSELPPEDANKNSIKQVNPPIEDLTQNTSIQRLETVPITSVSISQQLGHKDKKILKSKKKNYMLRSLVSSDRVLRSRTQEKAKAPEPSNELNKLTAGEGKRKKKKRNIKGKGASGDEFSSIRNRLRYLVNRIKYEQSLIDAYSSEGWKGFRYVFSSLMGPKLTVC